MANKNMVEIQVSSEYGWMSLGDMVVIHEEETGRVVSFTIRHISRMEDGRLRVKGERK